MTPRSMVLGVLCLAIAGSGPIQAQAPACATGDESVITGFERAAAYSPEAFARQVDLASCYDHAWRFNEVQPAIAKAMAILETERTSAASKVSRPDGRPVGGEALPVPKRTRDALGDYPTKALVDGISGSVIVELVIDVKGNVREARAAQSIPALDNAAVQAAKKWKYEPTLVNGKASEIVTYGVVRFGQTMEPVSSDWLTLAVFHHAGGRLELARAALDSASARALVDRSRFSTYRPELASDSGADATPPEKIKHVPPNHPGLRFQLKSGSEWPVTIEALLDTQGNVVRAHIVGKPSVFDASALEAILQWKFKPAMRNGSPVVVAIQVIVNFTMT
jgi:TonB family protein